MCCRAKEALLLCYRAENMNVECCRAENMNVECCRAENMNVVCCRAGNMNVVCCGAGRHEHCVLQGGGGMNVVFCRAGKTSVQSWLPNAMHSSSMNTFFVFFTSPLFPTPVPLLTSLAFYRFLYCF